MIWREGGRGAVRKNGDRTAPSSRSAVGHCGCRLYLADGWHEVHPFNLSLTHESVTLIPCGAHPTRARIGAPRRSLALGDREKICSKGSTGVAYFLNDSKFWIFR